MAPETRPTARRQPQDVRSWIVVAIGFGTFGLVAATLGLSWLFAWSMDLAGPSALPPTAFPPPALQSDPAGELRDYQAAQRARLTGYGWADRATGQVRIPVARAMDMIAARGAAAYDPPDPPRWPEPRR